MRQRVKHLLEILLFVFMYSFIRIVIVKVCDCMRSIKHIAAGENGLSPRMACPLLNCTGFERVERIGCSLPRLAQVIKS